jgi:hypothetical protein
MSIKAVDEVALGVFYANLFLTLAAFIFKKKVGISLLLQTDIKCRFSKKIE